eukprot:GEMP01037453.1.p1 GENE.GEMP01037453.1~~GEMP01037453.1.p1  ORF type:complete len:352 (+),score=116.26 GEMP01037453.1:56-1111(+)
MKGFSMKLGTAAQKKPEPKKPHAAMNLFAQSMQDEDAVEAARIKQGFHPRVQINQSTSRRVREDMDALMKEDPNVFQFDELLEDDPALSSKARQAGPTEGLEQKKRVGLFIPDGGPQTSESQYVSRLEKMKEFRDMEKEIIDQRVINRERKKDQNQHGDKEVFVTSAYKDRLKEREKFQKDMALKEKMDEARDASKMEHGLGFVALHRTLLDSGRDATKKTENPTTEAKHEVKAEMEEDRARSSSSRHNDDDVKRQIDESTPRRPKQEEGERRPKREEGERSPKREEEGERKPKREEPAAIDEEPTQKKIKVVCNEERQKEERQREETAKKEREDKAQSARERYLARKKAT